MAMVWPATLMAVMAADVAEHCFLLLSSMGFAIG